MTASHSQDLRKRIDEHGADTAMARNHGRAPVGQRVCVTTPGRWELIGLRLSGVTAALAFPGATDIGVFADDLGDVLAPEWKPGDVVLRDDLKPHQSEEAVEAIEAAGARVVSVRP